MLAAAHRRTVGKRNKKLAKLLKLSYNGSCPHGARQSHSGEDGYRERFRKSSILKKECLVQN